MKKKKTKQKGSDVKQRGGRKRREKKKGEERGGEDPRSKAYSLSGSEQDVRDGLVIYALCCAEIHSSYAWCVNASYHERMVSF